MDKTKLSKIFANFQVNSDPLEVEKLSAGHIHDSYKIVCSNGDKYVLQKINNQVFKDVKLLMNTKVKVSEHLLKNKKEESKVLTFVPSLDGKYYYLDTATNAYYSLANYIPNCITIEKTLNNKCAEEAGILFGDFILQCSRLDPRDFPPIIPHFHNVTNRFEAFQKVMNNANPERYANSREYIALINRHIEEMRLLDELIVAKELKLRLTHNDPKLSNILFDQEFNGVCVIDTDTLMPGIMAFDFGDAVRTICSNSKEDEMDLSKISLNIEYFRSFSRGFLSKTLVIADENERNSLFTGIKVMVYIMAMRFLTDYLNDDVYYKTEFEDHNFIRARNQFKLLENVFLNKVKLEEIIKEEIRIINTAKLS